MFGMFTSDRIRSNFSPSMAFMPSTPSPASLKSAFSMPAWRMPRMMIFRIVAESSTISTFLAMGSLVVVSLLVPRGYRHGLAAEVQQFCGATISPVDTGGERRRCSSAAGPSRARASVFAIGATARRERHCRALHAAPAVGDVQDRRQRARGGHVPDRGGCAAPDAGSRGSCQVSTTMPAAAAWSMPNTAARPGRAAAPRWARSKGGWIGSWLSTILPTSCRMPAVNAVGRWQSRGCWPATGTRVRGERVAPQRRRSVYGDLPVFAKWSPSN
jgi:hypothetical protein